MDPVTGIAFAFGAASFLIDVFDKSVQAYGIYSVAKNLGKDSIHLTASLLIEERRLIQWGDGVGLKPAPERLGEKLRLPIDPRLKEGTEIYNTVVRILACIEDTLTDLASLKTKYGLQILEEDAPQDPVRQLHLSLRPSPSDDADPTHSASALSLQAAQNNSKKMSSSLSRFRKVKWAIKDKDGFEKFLGLLRYYNDSLLSILPKSDASTISRDLLAFLIGSADQERLAQLTKTYAMSKPSGRSSDRFGHDFSSYKSIASAAEISLNLNSQGTILETSMEIQEDTISYDSDASDLGTWMSPERGEVRVFVENKAGIELSYNERDLVQKAASRIIRLAKLLSEPKEIGFRTPRCVGYIWKHFTAKLVYEMPPNADPLTPPVTLHEILTDSKYHAEEPPSLDERFELAKSLARSIFEMHSSGWLHRDFSTKSILFFRSKSGSYDEIGDLNLHTPYISGFEVARPLTSDHSLRMGSWKLENHLFKHPGYLLNKEVATFCTYNKKISDNDIETLYYQPRHDYYSLGLVLLAIGVWEDFPALCLRMRTLTRTLIEVNQILEINRFQEDEDTSSTIEAQASRNLESELSNLSWLTGMARHETFEGERNDMDRVMLARGLPGHESFFAQYRQDLHNIIAEEDLLHASKQRDVFESLSNGYNMDSSEDDSYESDDGWRKWDRIFPLVKLREDAVTISNAKLRARMGKRYRDAVLCCINQGLGVGPAQASLEWLRAFNWRVVKELEKCVV
ncbi:hypothetical protein IQ06DRAFT_79624 [Phaeosphaeriaceae sp. SRC1lsM3a]|nr:hypothetical protein IQ06DRAFT_79624 [Stagonospora sp. SRC1lsM3a]